MLMRAQHKLTALMMACAKGYGPFARELLRRGAAMDLTDKASMGWAISWTRWSAQLAVVAALARAPGG